MMSVGIALILSAFMAGCGVAGILIKRNVLSILISSELILNGANVAFAAFAQQMASVEGHVFVLIIMTIAACEAAIGLALAVNLYRSRRGLAVDDLNELKG